MKNIQVYFYKVLFGGAGSKLRLRALLPILRSVIASLLVILGFSGLQRYIFMDVFSLLILIPIISSIASLLCYIISRNLNGKDVTLWDSIKCMTISFIFSTIIIYYKEDIIEIIISIGLKDYFLDIINIILFISSYVSFISIGIWESLKIRVYLAEGSDDENVPNSDSSTLNQNMSMHKYSKIVESNINFKPTSDYTKPNLIEESPILKEIFGEDKHKAKAFLKRDLLAIHNIGFAYTNNLKSQLSMINVNSKSEVPMKSVYSDIVESMKQHAKIVEAQADLINMLKFITKIKGLELNEEEMKKFLIPKSSSEFFSSEFIHWDKFHTYLKDLQELKFEIANNNIKRIEIEGNSIALKSLLKRVEALENSGIRPDWNNLNYNILVTINDSLLGKTYFDLKLTDIKDIILRRYNKDQFEGCSPMSLIEQFKDDIKDELHTLDTTLFLLDAEYTNLCKKYENIRPMGLPFFKYKCRIPDTAMDELPTSSINRRIEKFKLRYQIKRDAEINNKDLLPANTLQDSNYFAEIDEAKSSRDIQKKKLCLNLFVQLGICTQKESELS